MKDILISHIRTEAIVANNEFYADGDPPKNEKWCKEFSILEIVRNRSHGHFKLL